MNFVFRVDSSDKMGSGHVMRCLMLANSLLDEGHYVKFLCREHNGNIYDILQNPLLNFTLLKNTNLNYSNKDDNSWLGVNQEEDAIQTIKSLDGEVYDWLIIDHYFLDFNWERKLKKYVKKILVIDDLANRTHECNILVDSNYVDNFHKRYQNKTNSTCLKLLGPDYCFISKEFHKFRNSPRKRSNIVDRVLIYFGGVDQYNLTEKCLKIFSGNNLKHIKLDIVVGGMNKNHKNIKIITSKRDSTYIHRSLPNLANLMNSADLSIGAGGVTTWERMFLGLPSIIITIAENQIAGAEELSKNNYITYLGHYNELSPDQLKNSIIKKIEDRDNLFLESHSAENLVDGNGLSRIMSHIIKT